MAEPCVRWSTSEGEGKEKQTAHVGLLGEALARAKLIALLTTPKNKTILIM